jgi:nitrite reductase/ring-hydroxylating ferredoxin subunit
MPEPMHETNVEAQRLCDSSALLERGTAVLFDVLHFNQPARAFALRFEGKPVAYLNRCAHVPTEMDWQPGEFLDAEREHIVCSIHGATYAPASGRCVGGPCGRARLAAIETEERDGAVYWYPSRDTRPPLAPAQAPHDAAAAAPPPSPRESIP